MRSVFRAALLAALSLLAGATGAHADGWADAMSPYRSMGWTGSTPFYRSQVAPKAARVAAPRARAARVAQAAPKAAAPKAVARAAVAKADQRSQRRSRAARLSRGSVASGTVATRGGAVGVASFYWQPQRVASGGWFNPNAMTAAHKSLPFGTRVRVTHLANGRSVDVTINDRGPYIAGRIIDLSKAAAGVIRMTGQGIARIRMTILGR